MNYAEAKIQRQIVGWLSNYLKPPAIFSTIPLGGRGRGSERGDEGWHRGAWWKTLGAKAGLPDLFVARSGLMLWLEVKSSNGRLSDVQKRMHAALEAIGQPVEVVRSLDDAKAALARREFPLRRKRRSTEELEAAIDAAKT